MKLRLYLDYKDSGIDWIGNIPSTWKSTKIKFDTYVKGRVGWHGLNSEEFSDLGVHLVTGTDFKDGFVNWESCYRISEERYAEDPYIQLQEDDLLITKDGTIGKLARVKNLPVKASLNSGIFLIRAKNDAYLEDYLYWVLRSDVFDHFMDLHKAGSTIQHLYQEVFNKFAFPMPSYQEQQSLVSFLDDETSKLENLIAKQEKLIALLQEKRQAIISYTVTKGLNPDAKMKDSGVEWLGEVPEHWDLPKLKFIGAFSGGGTPSRDNPAYWNGNIPWVSPKDMKTKYIIDSEESITTEGLEGSTSNMLVPGHILMVVRSGILKHTIPVAINEVPVAINQDIKAIKLNEDRCFNKFFMYWVQGLNDLLLLTWAKQGATVESIEHAYLANSVIPQPTQKEQNEIVTHLDQETSKINLLIEKARSSIQLAKEHRTALISAAVTGKIDLRETA